MPNKELASKQLEKLAQRIKALRKAKGYTNYEHFAYKHGFNRVQYGRYENGSNISFKTLVRLVAAFDMTLAEFFSEGFDDPEPKSISPKKKNQRTKD